MRAIVGMLEARIRQLCPLVLKLMHNWQLSGALDDGFFAGILNKSQLAVFSFVF
ncbi:hypothetical protein D3C81_2119980 [compost metagenome]|jgi:hypothetical protein